MSIPVRLLEFTDLGNADRFAHDHAGAVRYTRARGWLRWDGRRWAPDDMGHVTRLAGQTVRNMYVQGIAYQDSVDDREYGTGLIRHALQSQSASRLRAMLEVAQAHVELASTIERFDQDPWSLNVGNGTIDLRTGELRPHSCADLLTKLAAPIVYDRAASCPTWLAFLERVLPSEGLRDFVQRAVGYSLTAETRAQVLFILHGSGANGKSVFLETVRALIGEYSRVAATSVFMERRGDGIPNDLAALHGARFVSTSETEAGRKLAAALIKNSTGGDTVTARFLHKEFFSFRPTFKLWLSTNHKPTIEDNSDGLWRRLRLIPFGVTIPENERDQGLPAKLIAELPGILAWAVEGALAWQRGGLPVPHEVQEATREYRLEEDPLAPFIDECCTLDPALEASTTDLLAAYTRWCRGTKPLNAESFARSIKRTGIEAARRVGPDKKRGWTGIGLRSVVSAPTAAAAPAAPAPARPRDLLASLASMTGAAVQS